MTNLTGSGQCRQKVKINEIYICIYEYPSDLSPHFLVSKRYDVDQKGVISIKKFEISIIINQT